MAAEVVTAPCASARLTLSGSGASVSRAGQETAVGATLIVAAHPDDEVIGAGAMLGQLGRLTLLHVTDGAPRNMFDATRYGFPSREAYARARRDELSAALASGNVVASARGLQVADQEAVHHIPEIAMRIATAVHEITPDLVITHPYEGGHPDHDACALAVHAAVRMLGPEAPPLFEFTSYHSFEGQFRAFDFLGSDECVATVQLTPDQVQRKRRMLDCFRTQQETLSLFKGTVERFRPAPNYNFAAPPHNGILYYEQYDWGMTGGRFRILAQEALQQLDFGEFA